MNEQMTTGNLAGQQPLSGQQYQALHQQYTNALIAIQRDVELRKWVMDQACDVWKSPSMGMPQYDIAEGKALARIPGVFYSPIDLAKEMHAFLVEGAQEERAE